MTLWPLVDDYYAGKNESIEVAEELRAARLDTANLAQLREKVDGLSAQLQAIDQRTVSKATMGAYRSRLVALARASGCQIRRVTVGASQLRPWHEDDDPLEERTTGHDAKDPSNLSLEKQPLALSVSGTMTELKSLLDRIRDDGTIVHVKSFEIRPVSQRQKHLILDLELWFFQLVPGAATS